MCKPPEKRSGPSGGVPFPVALVGILVAAFALYWRDGSLANAGAIALVASIALFVCVKLRSSGTENEKKSDFGLPPIGPAFTEIFPDGLKAQHQQSLVEKYGDVFTVPTPLRGIIPNQVIINEPRLVKELCVRRANNCRDPSSFTTRGDAFAWATREVVGTGVTGLKGEEWSWRKKALLKEFHRNRLLSDERGLLAAVLEEGRRMCDKLGRAADDGTAVEVDVLATEAAVSVVLFFLFGRRLEFETNEFRKSAKDMINCLLEVLMNPFYRITKHVPGTSGRRTYLKLKNARDIVDRVLAPELEMLLEERQCTRVVHPDRVPGSLMASLIENEPRFSEGGTASMLAEARVFVQAGFETTAHSLAFAMGMMAERPELADEIARRGREVLPREDSCQNVGDVKRAIEEAKIVNNFFHEALRLYPLAPSLGGECTDDVDIATKDGHSYTLPKGTSVFFLNYTLQRQVPDPDVIKPERWDKSPAEAPFLHTFQTGAHVCPGKPLSLLEGRVFLLLAAREFRFEFPEGAAKSVEYVDDLLLRPRDGMPLVLKRR